MNLGKAIKEIRAKKNLPRLEFAEKLEVSSNFLSLVENNKRNPSMQILERIAQQLDVPLPFLILLAIEETDIKEEKRMLYSKMRPLLKELIHQLVSEPNASNRQNSII